MKKFIVDVQHHILPLEMVDIAKQAGILDTSLGIPVIRWKGITFSGSSDMINLSKHMKVSKAAGLTHIMLSFAMLTTIANELLNVPTYEAAKMHNDNMVKIRDQYPNMIFPYCAVNPHDGDEAIKEMERCIDQLGFKAVSIDTSYGTTNKVFNHTIETYKFWKYVNDKEIPVYVHPSFLCYGWEWMDRYKFEETVGRPAETALSVSLMILSGLFDMFPKLKIILAHMGGGFLMCLPRLQFGHKLGYEGFLDYQKGKNKKEPIEYVRQNIWADTMGFDPAGIKHAIEVFGIDHILLGTDYAAVPITPKEHIDIVCDQLGLSEDDQNKILGLNAKKLYNLPDSE